MEVLKLVDYENSETGIEASLGVETKAGAVKHNGLMGLLTDGSCPGRQERPGRAPERRQAIYT
jgi:hypothetical protein